MNENHRSVKVYLTQEEYNSIYMKAKELDITVTNYIYRKALDKPIYYHSIDR